MSPPKNRPDRKEETEGIGPYRQRALPPLLPQLSLSFHLSSLPQIGGVSGGGGGCVEEGLSNPH